MNTRPLAPLALCLPLLVASPAAAQHAAHPVGRNIAEMTFAPVPGLPACAAGAVQTGDPATGPTIVASRIEAGCVIPWHWHTPNEHLILASGTARVESRVGPPVTLRAGCFALMPSRHVHQFRCEEACVLYVYSDAAFDIHYVDGQGTEITAADAFAAAKTSAAARPR